MQPVAGIRRIVGCECAVVHEGLGRGERGHVLSGHEVRTVLSPHVRGADLFRVEIVNSVLPHVEIDVAIDSGISVDGDFSRARIVLGRIGIDVRVADMNGDVIVSGRDAILIVRLSTRRNLDRKITKSWHLCLRETDRRNEQRYQQERLTHGGRRKYRRTALLQSQKGFRELLQPTFVPGGGQPLVGSIRKQERVRAAIHFRPEV